MGYKKQNLKYIGVVVQGLPLVKLQLLCSVIKIYKNKYCSLRAFSRRKLQLLCYVIEYKHSAIFTLGKVAITLLCHRKPRAKALGYDQTDGFVHTEPAQYEVSGKKYFYRE
ncbi:MAG: hypothetical protein RLZZ628_614 [Bacteroidota bacterium]|jgi:hypothetical protein